MNLISKSVRYVSSEKVLIPFEGRVDCNVKEGNYFDRGDELFSTEKRKIIDSYYLPQELEIKEEKAKDYVCRIEGEYITKGEVIAEKLMSGGLLSKRLSSKSEGIIDFSRLDEGYVDILAETKSQKFKSKFSGYVVDINLGKGITVCSDVCDIPLFSINSKNKGRYLTSTDLIYGELEVLGDAESIPSVKNLKKSYENKVVFAGRFLYPDMVLELFTRGASFVVLGSMDYNSFVDLKVPAGLLIGYGNVYFDKVLFGILRELNKSHVCIDFDSNSMKILVGLNSKLSELIKPNYFKQLEVSDIVRSLEVESFGMIGKVTSLKHDGQYAEVAMQDESVFEIETKNLLVYQEDFSILGFSIY